MTSEKHVVFTSVNFNYLGRALTLARSIKRYDPSVYFILFLVEPDIELTQIGISILLGCDSGKSFDEIMTLDDLYFTNSGEFQNYTVVEMCTAVKGQIAVQLLARQSSQYVTYLDPDLFFYRELSDIREMHTNGDVLLTPHLNHIPYSTEVIQNDEIAGILRHGVFNLGFISFKNTKSGRKMAGWWADRLQISSKADYLNGLFTDQKWWDLSQIYFKDAYAVKDDGWNMAPWNVSERRLISMNPPTLECGDSLFFFHFSKFPSSEFNEKIRVSNTSLLLSKLIAEYRQEFSNSQLYVEKVLSSIKTQGVASRSKKRLISKRKPKTEMLLTNILIYLSRNVLLRKIFSYNSFLMIIAKTAYGYLYKMIYKIETVEKNRKIDPAIEDIHLDLLIISHKGGGGVSEALKGRILEFMGQGKVVGVIKRNDGGDLVLNLNNSANLILGERSLSQIFNNSTEIEIHHILGFENELSVLLNKKINRFFLHDKYLISQMPFSDTRQFLARDEAVAGIDLPLNKNSRIQPDEWQVLTRELLHNSIKVFAPSDYLIKEYKSTFPEIDYEKITLEPNFKPVPANSLFNGNRPFIVISPTGIHKGSSVLANVARTLEISRPSTVFMVFGDLEVRTERELKSLRNVILQGQISNSRLNHALDGFRYAIGWIPSLTGESYSLALSDFLSNGLTVIATNTGALTERLRGFPGNYLYDPAIPPEVLSSLLVALSENKSIEEFLTYLELT